MAWFVDVISGQSWLLGVGYCLQTGMLEYWTGYFGAGPAAQVHAEHHMVIVSGLE